MSERRARDIQTVLAHFAGTPLSLTGVGYVTRDKALEAAKRLAQASQAVQRDGLTAEDMETYWPGMMLALGFEDL